MFFTFSYIMVILIVGKVIIESKQFKSIIMLNILLDIVSFPVRMLKKVPNVSLGGFVPLRFALAIVFAGASAACFITASNGYSRFVFSVLGWVFLAAVIDVFAYANAEEKAIEKDENVK